MLFRSIYQRTMTRLGRARVRATPRVWCPPGAMGGHDEYGNKAKGGRWWSWRAFNRLAEKESKCSGADFLRGQAELAKLCGVQCKRGWFGGYRVKHSRATFLRKEVECDWMEWSEKKFVERRGRIVEEVEKGFAMVPYQITHHHRASFFVKEETALKVLQYAKAEYLRRLEELPF